MSGSAPTVGHWSARGAGWRELALRAAAWIPVRWAGAISAPLGWLFCLVARADRMTLRANQRGLLGARGGFSEWKLLLATFGNFAACLGEFLALARRGEPWAPRCEVEGEAQLVGLLEQQAGAVVVTVHAGPWDAAGPALSPRLGGRQLALVMAPEPSEGARVLHDKLRARAGVKVCLLGGHATDGLELARRLREGQWLAFQVDRAPQPMRSVRVGALAVPLGPFWLAARAGVPVIGVFAERLGALHYRLSILPPQRLPERASPGAIEAIAADVGRRFSELLKARPDQWFAFGPEPRDFR